MKIPLEAMAQFAGHSLTGEELERVRAFLEEYLEEVRQLRALELPDDIEPVTHLHLERWD